MLGAVQTSKGKANIYELITNGKIEDRFSIGDVIGQGAYSTVRVATEKATKKKVAIKYIDKRRAFLDMNLYLECQLLRQLGRHPNINAFLGLYESAKCYMIVLEFMKGGELLDILIKRVEQGNTPYTEAQVAVIMRQVVSAVDHCHRNGIIHRDLKPENILISDEGALGNTNTFLDQPLKLADFGLATVITPGTRLKETCGTPNYMAPERLVCMSYDEKSDIWSIGVLMYILIAGTFPFYGDTGEEIYACTCNPDEPNFGEAFQNISRPCIELLRDQLLAQDSDKRPTANELLRHPWMTGELASTAEIKGALAQLKKFNARRKFRAGVRALVASNRLKAILGGARSEAVVFELMDFGITPVMVRDLNKVFAKNTNGTYEADEDVFIKTIEEEFGIPKSSLIMDLFNAFRIGSTVNTRDLCLSLATKLGADEKESLLLAFEIFDTDRSGLIDQKEYAEMIISILKSLGDSFKPNELWLQQEFEQADTDQSGQISKQEFVDIARKNVKIKAYMCHIKKMIKSKNDTLASDLEQKKRTRSGDIFLLKEHSGFLGGGAKERWLVVDSERLEVHKSEDKWKKEKPPVMTLDISSLNIQAPPLTKEKPPPMTLDMKTDQAPSSNIKNRSDCKLRLDAGKSMGSYILETSNVNEAKMWTNIFKEAGVKMG